MTAGGWNNAVWRYYSVAVGGSPTVGGLVGRDGELAVLDPLAARTAAGVGGVVLLSGEPGVGETRLAREAAGRARAADLARPILDELLPYASRNLIQGVPVGWGAAAWHIARLQWLP